MKITFLGAARAVTGSCYLVQTERLAFLVDCGMFQGNARESLRNGQSFPFDPGSIDFVLLTHAHIDHSGRIPKLWLDGYRGPVYATKATADLCQIMLPDSGHIQETEAEWRARKSRRGGLPETPPLYTAQDALDACKLLRARKYDQEFQPAEGVRVVFRDAGHTLGSSIVELWIADGGTQRKVVFSGDLGNRDIPILRDPSVIEGADVLVMESTYGDRLHVREDKVGRLFDVIDETVARGGNVVIPSFAVGRTQEVIYELNKKYDVYGHHMSTLQRTPVYVDSPLAVSATQVFRENTDCFDAEARAYIENGDNPLDFPNLRFTASLEESKAINADRSPKIILSASGMCDAGRIKHHLKHNLWRAESTIVFVGYQAQGTLGRALLDGAKRVRLFGEQIQVNARIEMLEGFSGHADQAGLLDWVAAMKKKPSRILLSHGEPEAMGTLAALIRQRLGVPAEMPEIGQTVDLSQAPVAQVASAHPAPPAAPMIPLLDALQEDFLLALDGIKAAYAQADPAALDELNRASRDKLRQSAEALLQKFDSLAKETQEKGA